jgi:phage terminase large subunit
MLTIEGLELFQRQPDLFFEHVLGVKYESYQKEILNNIVAHDRLAVAACHSVGKSWTLARVVLWYLYCFPYSKVITTAPTSRQVEKILWSEIRTAHMHSKIPLGGRVLTTEIKVTEEGDWGAIGFSPSNEVSTGEGQGTQSSFQGWHAENLMVIFDEATGVRPAIWTMAEGLLTTSGVKFIAIANPTSTQSEFYKCFANRAWAKQKINCFHSPNLIENGIIDGDRLFTEIEYCRTLDDAEFLERMKSYKVVKGYLLTTRWVIEKALDWGLDSALFLSKVLGEFPEEGDNVTIPLRVVEEAQRRSYEPQITDRKILGVDVARFGTDSSVITRMHGAKVLEKRVKNKRRETELVGEIVNMCSEDMPDIIVVDETGLGAGVVDMLVELRNEGMKILTNVEIRGVQFGASPAQGDPDNEVANKEKEKYVNLKARMFDLLAKDMRSNIALIDEEVYLSELPSIQYKYDSKGRMAIESKDEYKKRTGRGSPDHADSLALANYGRHDELTVGEFSAAYSKPQTTKPRSWGKKEKAKW